MFKWPKRDEVDRALQEWVKQAVASHPEVVKLGYFGSFARRDWGVGSDLDLIAIVKESTVSFERRPLAWRLDSLPVPAEILVYTKKEWREMTAKGGRFVDTLQREVVWIDIFRQ